MVSAADTHGREIAGRGSPMSRSAQSNTCKGVDGLQNQDVVYVTDSLDGEPRILIDPNTFSEDATVALASWSPSPDGRWIAYSTSDGGTDWKTWNIRSVETRVGHGSGKPTWMRIEGVADQWAFLVKALEMEL